MAFNIGKKKTAPADDWSEAALAGDAGSNPDNAEPANAFGDNIVADDAAPARKSLAPVLLAAGAVLLLTAVGLGVYFLFLNKPAQDADEPIVATAPAVGLKPAVKTTPPVKAPTKTPVRVVKKPADDPKKIVVNPAPGTVVKVKPGRAGLVPPGTKVPALDSAGDKPPAMVPTPNTSTPVDIMRDGVAGQSGKGLPVAAAVPVVRPAGPISPALKARLKTLWQQGAAAKHRGDKAAARLAWQKILKLRPGHPGIQEAIDKLN